MTRIPINTQVRLRVPIKAEMPAMPKEPIGEEEPQTHRRLEAGEPLIVSQQTLFVDQVLVRTLADDLDRNYNTKMDCLVSTGDLEIA
jgi:hypothetical protein